MATELGRFPGVPELLVLRLLSEREMYGYEIVQAIALRTAQVFEPGEGLTAKCLALTLCLCQCIPVSVGPNTCIRYIPTFLDPVLGSFV